MVTEQEIDQTIEEIEEEWHANGFFGNVRDDHELVYEVVRRMCSSDEVQTPYMVGQRVILRGTGGTKEIGTVVPPPENLTTFFGVWVMSPTKGYASDYALSSVSPLPNGQM